MPRPVALLATLAAAAACSSPPPERPADSLTARERDSAIGASGLPGAAGISKAMTAADSAAARNAALDSLERRP